MRLEPLQEQHTRLLVQRILPPDAWNEHAVARIVRAAGGNPLFVEELLTAFVDEGAESENGMTVARTIQAADIPISIMARSNSANTPSICTIIRPEGVAVSNGSVAERNDTPA